MLLRYRRRTVSTSNALESSEGTPAPPERADDATWWARLGVPMVLVGVAGVLGAVGLGTKSFWHDEAFTAAMVELPFDRFAEVAVGRELNQALYYLILRPWSAAFGTGESALRSLSVLGAMATVALVVVLGRRLVGPRAASLAGAMLAVNPFFIQYAQEARSYTVTLAVLVGAGIALLWALDRPSGARLAAYAVLAGLSVYVHFFAALVVVSHVAGVLVARLPWRRIVPAWVGVAVAFLPVLAFLATVDTDDVDTVARPSLGSALDVVATTVGGAGLLVALVGLSVLAAGDRRHAAGSRLLAVWLVLPLVATFVFSVAVKPMFLDRFLIVVLPALVLLAGAGSARLRLVPQAFALVVVATLSVSGLLDWYEGEKQKDWRSASAFVSDGYQAGDAVSFVRPHVRTAFDYYNRRRGEPVAATSIVSPPAEWGVGDLKADIPPFDVASVARVAPRHPRLWAFFTHRPGPGTFGGEALAVADAIETRYRPVEERNFDGLVVVLYERTSSRPTSPRMTPPAHMG